MRAIGLTERGRGLLNLWLVVGRSPPGGGWFSAGAGRVFFNAGAGGEKRGRKVHIPFFGHEAFLSHIT